MSPKSVPVTVCANCSSDGVTTEPVQRVYLDPGAPDDLEAATIDDEVEAWCGSCVANYPHLAAPVEG